MTDLFDKIYGCIAASNIGSAMGAGVEGWSTEKFGVLDRFLPYNMGGREMPPGTTEDGIERQRLMCTAIIGAVDKATKQNEHAVSKRTLKETAQGLYEALLNTANKMKHKLRKSRLLEDSINFINP